MSTALVAAVAGNCHLAVAPLGRWGHSCVRLKLKDLDVPWDEPWSYRSGSQSHLCWGFKGQGRSDTLGVFWFFFLASFQCFDITKSGINRHTPDFGVFRAPGAVG